MRTASDSSFWRRRASNSWEGEKSGGSCCVDEGVNIEEELDVEAKGTKKLKASGLKAQETGFEWKMG